ncbi:hypothetical protein DNU06_14125 [Putridiphycobacter roseus]|uniref:Uncharacterized protein n=1 Tax=Putridiphycobacter roseus TaxID=2219161 RepID=A0A2W1NKS4_9FLAO|nr:hypothetical protein [Putridiphycobacter roseus]PZE16262.1 hypothetical protein DNU06_14125 [Putridiphycobacter roseus]
MRLGQLARRLERKPQELVDFLIKEHEIAIETDLNTKIEGVALELVMEAFKVELPPVDLPEAVEVPVPIEEEITVELVEVPEAIEPVETVVESVELPEIEIEIVEMPEAEIALSDEEIENVAAAAVVAEIDAEEPTETVTEHVVEKIARVGEDGEELPELIVEDGVIKAPKLELDGFKVVGKIELPTIKRSVEFLVTNGDVTEDVTETIYETRSHEAAVRKKKAVAQHKNRKVKQVTKRNSRTLTEADRKAHADRRAIRKKEEAEVLLQEKKKQHYFENVQKKTLKSSRQKKTKEIAKAVKKQSPVKKAPAPTTLWGKFKKWLND